MSAPAARREQGASTITQQVAKNFLLTNERSYERKIREALLALRIEATFSKDKILELYLNEIYLGLAQLRRRRRGAELFRQVGARADHRRGRLSRGPAEGAEQLPSRSARRRPRIERRNWVIDRMVENGYITREEADAAKKEPLDVNPRSISPNSIASGYFAEEVRREIAERYGEEKLYEGGLSIRATLDPQDAGDGAQGAGRRAGALRRGARLARRASRSSN